MSKVFISTSGIYIIFNRFILTISFGIKKKNQSFNRVEIDLSKIEDDVGVFWKYLLSILLFRRVAGSGSSLYRLPPSSVGMPSGFLSPSFELILAIFAQRCWIGRCYWGIKRFESSGAIADLSSIMFTTICKDYSLIHCSELIRNDMD